MLKELKSLPDTTTANMIEVMACEGGCVNGCNVIANPKTAMRQVAKIAQCDQFAQ
jgi:iron only hydrogenase large subunit-like protein